MAPKRLVFCVRMWHRGGRVCVTAVMHVLVCTCAFMFAWACVCACACGVKRSEAPQTPKSWRGLILSLSLSLLFSVVLCCLVIFVMKKIVYLSVTYHVRIWGAKYLNTHSVLAIGNWSIACCFFKRLWEVRGGVRACACVLYNLPEYWALPRMSGSVSERVQSRTQFDREWKGGEERHERRGGEDVSEGK